MILWYNFQIHFNWRVCRTVSDTTNKFKCATSINYSEISIAKWLSNGYLTRKCWNFKRNEIKTKFAMSVSGKQSEIFTIDCEKIDKETNGMQSVEAENCFNLNILSNNGKIDFAIALICKICVSIIIWKWCFVRIYGNWNGCEIFLLQSESIQPN